MNASAQIQKQGQSGAISRKAFWWLAIPLFIVVSLVALGWAVKQKYEHARAEWKAGALQRLAGSSISNEEINRELETLKEGPIREGHRDWVSDNVLLMTNGEYVIYAYRHGANSGFVDHLFLAHSSDGRWLYSTYHFCNAMAMVRSDEAPGSVTEFAKTYSAREFDGKSDECLKKTWPLNN